MSVAVALYTNSIDSKCGWGRISIEYVRALENISGVSFILVMPDTESNRDAATDSAVPDIVWTPFAERTKHHRARRWLTNWPRANYLKNIDIVHALTDYPYCINAYFSAYRSRLPLIVWLHGTFAVRPLTYFPSKQLLSSCYRYSSRLVSVSQYTQSMMMVKAKIDPSKCCVIPNAYTPPADSRVEVPKGINRHQFSLLTVGALKKRKGQNCIIEALRILRDSGYAEDIGYYIVGDDRSSYAELLRETARRYALEDHVYVMGRRSQGELNWLYENSDIYVHTPVVHDEKFEGYGLVYLEAGYHRLPVIASQSGGAAEAVQHGETGLVVPESDATSTAQAIRELCDNPGLRSTYGAMGREKACSWTWKDYANSMSEMYTSVLRSDSSGRRRFRIRAT